MLWATGPSLLTVGSWLWAQAQGSVHAAGPLHTGGQMILRIGHMRLEPLQTSSSARWVSLSQSFVS